MDCNTIKDQSITFSKLQDLIIIALCSDKNGLHLSLTGELVFDSYNLDNLNRKKTRTINLWQSQTSYSQTKALEVYVFARKLLSEMQFVKSSNDKSILGSNNLQLITKQNETNLMIWNNYLNYVRAEVKKVYGQLPTALQDKQGWQSAA